VKKSSHTPPRPRFCRFFDLSSYINISILTLLLFGASSQCFALQENIVVSKDKAKTMGVALRWNPNGEAGVKVWIEFKTEGKLKNFARVELEMTTEGKHVVSAPLLTSRPTADGVSAYFSAEPSYLATSVLTIVVQDGPRTRIGYQFRVRDFMDHEKPR
jgi:hypothetical protein